MAAISRQPDDAQSPGFSLLTPCTRLSPSTLVVTQTGKIVFRSEEQALLGGQVRALCHWLVPLGLTGQTGKGAGEMVLRLRVLEALQKDMGSIPSAHSHL